LRGESSASHTSSRSFKAALHSSGEIFPAVSALVSQWRHIHGRTGLPSLSAIGSGERRTSSCCKRNGFGRAIRRPAAPGRFFAMQQSAGSLSPRVLRSPMNTSLPSKSVKHKLCRHSRSSPLTGNTCSNRSADLRKIADPSPRRSHAPPDNANLPAEMLDFDYVGDRTLVLSSSINPVPPSLPCAPGAAAPRSSVRGEAHRPLLFAPSRESSPPVSSGNVWGLWSKRSPARPRPDLVPW